MQQRLSDVVWLIEQILWKRLDKRIASFLVEEAALEDTLKLTTTHVAALVSMGESVGLDVPVLLLGIQYIINARQDSRKTPPAAEPASGYGFSSCR